MGEVYRAEDMVLGAEVALKFIADVLTNDESSRERLAAEVRTARRVTHPNVCRVHDLGDINGRRFISMEYIGGEDLSTLLRRIGRLPVDKGLEISRQIGEALQAAHDQDVLHRDLKPSNVLIDGKGTARLVDFGLAALTNEVRRGDGTLIGTPAYMSPEQLAGKPCSIKSEIYAFGLIVYELLTGKAVFKPKTLDELYDLHKQPKVPALALVPELDPGVDEVIMRCLEEDPEKRPESIAAALAALPGGDALTRAIASGHTPSPEMLAASGACRGLSAGLALAALALILLGLIGNTMLFRRAGLIPRVPLDKPLAALDDRAQTLLNELGYKTQGMNSASDFDIYERLLWTIAKNDSTVHRWDRLSRGRPAPIDYWYRQGVLPLVPSNDQGIVTMWDPPHAVAGMVAVRLDPLGRLRELTVVTEPISVGQPPGAGAWGMPKPEAISTMPVNGQAPCDKVVFEAAGLDIDKFTPTKPLRIPPLFADDRRAWTGTYPEYVDEPIRVEIATLGSHVVAFRIIEERWAEASSWSTPAMSAEGIFGRTFLIASDVMVLVGGAWLAWRNMHEHRGDTFGAAKVAGVVTGLLFFSMILLRRHTASAVFEAAIVRDALLFSISRGVIAWVGYVALEPVVRRLWPRTLVAWSRALAGKSRDPMMGQCLLIGVGAGVACALITALENLAPGWVGQAPPLPVFDKLAGVDALQSSLDALGASFAIIVQWIGRCMVFLLGLALVGLVTPRRRLATIIYASLAVVAWTLSRHALPGAGPWWSTWIGSTLVVGIATFVIVRSGLLAAVLAGVTYELLIAFPVPASTSVWYWGTSVAVLLGIAALACVGAYLSSGTSRRPARRPAMA
jgi:serine/threonine-protein kinase